MNSNPSQGQPYPQPGQPWPPPGYSGFTPPPNKPKPSLVKVLFGVVGGFFALMILLGILASPSTPTAPAVAAQVAPNRTAIVAPAAVPSEPATTFTSGTYAVGADFPPGTYTTPGSDFCGWSRLKGTSGELSDIIANDTVQGPGIVTVKASDADVQLVGNCTWTRK